MVGGEGGRELGSSLLEMSENSWLFSNTCNFSESKPLSGSSSNTFEASETSAKRQPVLFLCRFCYSFFYQVSPLFTDRTALL